MWLFRFDLTGIKCFLFFYWNSLSLLNFIPLPVLSLMINCDVVIRVCPIFLKKIGGFGFVCITTYPVCTGRLLLTFLLSVTCFFHYPTQSQPVPSFGLWSVSWCSVLPFFFSNQIWILLPLKVLKKKKKLTVGLQFWLLPENIKKKIIRAGYWILFLRSSCFPPGKYECSWSLKWRKAAVFKF